MERSDHPYQNIEAPGEARGPDGLAPGAEEDADSLFDAVATRLRETGARLPRATYRLQLSGQLSFRDVEALLPYFRELGVSHLYFSPLLHARPDSPHGYDLVDHNALDPALGSSEAFDQLARRMSEYGLCAVLDFVPNHMGVGPQNAWWMDVLENGPSSLYSPFFDIDWTPLKSELSNKVLLPILGDHYGRVLENGELVLRCDQGGFFVHYWEHVLPVNPRTYPSILEPMLEELVPALGEEHDAVLELQSIITGFEHLPARTESRRAKVIERRREKEILKRRLATLLEESPHVARALENRLVHLNGSKDDPRSFDDLDNILEQQGYRLSFWRVAAEEINYRRFFDINDLAAIRMERPEVFTQAHRLVFDLLGSGRIHGLRIDHPDGLWDPRGYFAALQRNHFAELCRHHLLATARADGARSQLEESFAKLRPTIAELFERARMEEPDSPLAKPLYIVAEKILSRGETLPEDWPVHGTSGYEFAIAVGGLFVDRTSESALTECYERFTGLHLDFESLVYQKKKLVLQTSMASELNVLAHALNRLSERDRHSRDFTLGLLTDALREVIACFPVYRTYVTEDTEVIAEHDRLAVARAIRHAWRRNPTTDASVYRFLRAILMLEVPPTVPPEDHALWREFVMRFQQLTGPVMAKGLEDTAFYVYNRLVSLNEVGGEPERFGLSVPAFHRANQQRQRTWPYSLLSTSTHDTKRSEDVRARISVLSELPAEWSESVNAWSRIAEPFRTELDQQTAPDRNEEYLLYQTLVGSSPFERPTGEALERYTDRIVGYMHKATKEAKVNTSWVNANPDYDSAVERFVRKLLQSPSFWEAFEPFARKVAWHGMWGALAQTLLKFTSPGVPDLYQGNEIWDFSLVDPDNRRPVDFTSRASTLAALRERTDREQLASELVSTARDGRIKLHVTVTALETRRRLPDLFGGRGAYVPLEPVGRHTEHLVTFSRRHGESEVVVVVPRMTARLLGGRLEAPLGEVWKDTWIPVAEGRFRDLFTGREVHPVEADGGSVLRVDQVLATFPVALLERVSGLPGHV